MSGSRSARAVVVATGLLRGAVGALAALVPATAVAETVGRHPLGDAVLWEPGGVWLVEALWYARTRLPARPLVVVGLTVLALAVWSLPLGALIATRTPSRALSWREAWSRGRDAFARLTLLAAMTAALQVVAVGFLAALVGYGGAPAVDAHWEGGRFGRGAVVGVAVALLLGVVADLARARIVWRDEGLGRALVGAFGWARRAALRLVVGVAARLGAVGAVLAGAGMAVVALVPRWPIPGACVASGAAILLMGVRSAWFGWLAGTLPPEASPPDEVAASSNISCAAGK